MKQSICKWILCICLTAAVVGICIRPQAAVQKTETKSSSGESTEDAKELSDSSEGDEILSAKESLFGDLPLPQGSQEEAAEPEDKAGSTEAIEEEAASVPPEDKEAVLSPDEGMLSEPDHPIATTTERMVFIGDSRTVDIMNAVHDDSVWACKVSMGYQWMATEAVPAVDSYIDAGTAVIILMGVNDVYNISNYIGYTNEKAAEWAARGATTYYVSVGPVTHDPYVTNTEIEAFNAALQANLSGVNYIDIYTYLTENGYSTVDGTHYPDNVSIAIYNYIIQSLEENRDGIW